eukprot:850709-Amorphochlora_amoeboformis.AAC.2
MAWGRSQHSPRNFFITGSNIVLKTTLHIGNFDLFYGGNWEISRGIANDNGYDSTLNFHVMRS